MRSVLVLNPKGGCGKTTVATSLAAFLAGGGKRVGLVDFDRQGSAADWLDLRPEGAPPISAVTVDVEAAKALIPRDLEWLVMDAPGHLHGKELKKMVRKAQMLLIPVLPSPIDIRATARFIEELLLVGRINRKETRIAVVANRARENTVVYHTLQRFLASLGIPFIATLRDSMNYIRAAERGLGVGELAPALAQNDVEQWRSLLRWLKGAGARPLKPR